jgi:hypothetical protein
MFAIKPQKKVERLDFIIAGVQKGGTSALHYHLDQHPNITMAHSEEAHMIDAPHRHFFDDDERFASGPVDYDILHEGIRFKRRSLITGSCTPVYTYWRPAMERIREYHPGIKLIVLLRNPVDRAFSHWNMTRDRNQEHRGFLEAIVAERERAREIFPSQLRRTAYLDRGFYFEQIERVLRFFPREQVHVIKFEEFRKRTSELANEVFRFLGVQCLEKVKNREQNLIPYNRKITSEERDYLYSLYRSDIVRLEKLLNWDCSDWKVS